MYTATSAAISRKTRSTAILERLRRALERGRDRAAAVPTASRPGRLRDGAAERGSCARLNEIVTAGNCARWLIDQRRLPCLIFGDGRQRHLPVLPVWVGR